MDVNVVTTLVSNVGFPIACVVAMFWQTNKLREDHKEESNKWVEAINNNTVVMTKILARLEMGGSLE